MPIRFKDLEPDKINPLVIEKSEDNEYPKEIKLVLNLRYDRAVLVKQGEKPSELSMDELDKRTVAGFNILSTSYGYIELQREPSLGRPIKVKAEVKKGWHTGYQSEIKLIAKLDPKEIYEIAEKLSESDVIIQWYFDAFCYYEKNEIKELERVIGHHYGFIFKVPQKDFVEKVIKPVDGLQRRFLEITLPTKEFLDKVPSDLKPLANALKDKLNFLVDALEELAEARTSKDYRNVLTHTRLAEDRLSEKIGKMLDVLKSKLFLELGTFKGEAIDTEAEQFVKSIRSIIGSLENLCSIIGMHSTTKGDVKSYKAYPERIDAQYILYASILTLDYIIKRLRKYVIEKS